MEIAVFGSGGWGTALAILLHQNGHQVTLWSYLEEESMYCVRSVKPAAAGCFAPGTGLYQ